MILFFMYKANIEYAVGTRLERSYQKSKEIGYIDTPETIEDEWTESDEQELDIETRKLDILFSSNHNIHKSSSGHCFWASDPSIHRCY